MVEKFVNEQYLFIHFLFHEVMENVGIFCGSITKEKIVLRNMYIAFIKYIHIYIGIKESKFTTYLLHFSVEQK